jgi:hypothetical protein
MSLWDKLSLTDFYKQYFEDDKNIHFYSGEEPKILDLPIISEQVFNDLITYGFSFDKIFLAFTLHKFKTINEAISVLTRDPSSKKFKQSFLMKENDNLKCELCDNVAKDHYNYEADSEKIEITVNIETNKLALLADNNESSYLHLQAKDTSLVIGEKENNVEISIFDIHPSNKLKICQNIKIPNETLDSFEDPLICSICFDNKLNSEYEVKLQCGHQFCITCVQNYLRNKVNNGDVNIVF